MMPRLVVLTILIIAGLEYLRFRVDGARFWKVAWSWVKYPLLSLSLVAVLFFTVGILVLGVWPWEPGFFFAADK